MFRHRIFINLQKLYMVNRTWLMDYVMLTIGDPDLVKMHISFYFSHLGHIRINYFFNSTFEIITYNIVSITNLINTRYKLQTHTDKFLLFSLVYLFSNSQKKIFTLKIVRRRHTWLTWLYGQNKVARYINIFTCNKTPKTLSAKYN